MKPVLRLGFLLGVWAVAAAAAPGHYNMLLPERPATNKGQAISFTYQWGHPFEHQLFDAPAPQTVFVVAPDGKKTDLSKRVQQTVRPMNADIPWANQFNLQFNPPERGDYVFVLNTPPIWMEEEQEFFLDTVKVVLHVQAQKGWDSVVGQGFEMVPLTRPYGLQAGMVFQAQAVLDGKPLPRALVEIERYNAAPPKQLPADEHITRSVRTDPNGVATCTLTEAGWWAITAQRDGGEREHKGKKYPVKQRTTLWVYVDEKAK